jgi:hypothetical protein
MPDSRLHRNRPSRHAALLALAAATLAATAACSGGGITVTGSAPTLGPDSPAPGVSASGAPAVSAPAVTGAVRMSTAAGTASAGEGAGSSAPLSVPACGNADLALGNGYGYGSQSEPVQWSGIVITNVGDRACTLRGYPGAAIVVDGRTINAVRALNVYHGDRPPLTSPPLVTLAPGAGSYAVMQWTPGKGPGCYPSGDGALEVTAPDTTRTVVLSRAVLMGSGQICSGFEVGPVQAGSYGVPVGAPARN